MSQATPEIERGRLPAHRARILVVDRDPAQVTEVRNILRAEGWEVLSAQTGAEAQRKARDEGLDAVISELDLPDMGAPDLCRALRERSETATVPIIVLSANTGVAERVACLRASATDYLVRPAEPRELIARLQAALDLRSEKAGYVVIVLGSKGGVGTSMVASNLALALRRQTHAGVALLDAALHSGAIDVMLNVQTLPGVGRLLARQTGELEEGDFENLLVSHASGLQAMSLQGQGLETIEPDDVQRVLVTLRRLRDLVVVDTWPVLDETTAAILDLADRVVLVLTPEITSLCGASLILQRLGTADLPRERIVPILNRFPQRGGLQRSAIESTLGMPVQATLPEDPRLVTYSINRGVPLCQSHPRSSVARQMEALARNLLEVTRHPKRMGGPL